MIWWAKLAVVGAILVGAAFFVRHERAVGFAAGQLELKAGYDREFARASSAARAKEEQQRTAVEASHAQDIKLADAQIASGLAARAELDQLRERLSHPSRPAPHAHTAAGSVPDASSDYAGLLLACAERYTAVAADAGSLAAQVIGLQGYVRGVVEIGGSGSPVGESLRAGLVAPAIQPTIAPSRFRLGSETAHPTLEEGP